MFTQGQIEYIVGIQLNQKTRERFADLKEGDLLKVRNFEDIENEAMNALISCGWDENMRYSDVASSEIIFSEENFNAGNITSSSMYSDGFYWSLDMLEYVTPKSKYAVELL